MHDATGWGLCAVKGWAPAANLHVAVQRRQWGLARLEGLRCGGAWMPKMRREKLAWYKGWWVVAAVAAACVLQGSGAFPCPK